MPRNGRLRTLIITETVILTALLVLLVAIMVYAVTATVFGVTWFSVGVAAAAVLGEIIRRYRHLRTDLRRYPPRDRRIGDVA
jgi:hypothetical protein